ncbi:MAG TPA: hypothetical protein VNN80_21655 [Polyangiaceae bacterium]|nr:hypothetical protein [Polyangiaceae bacterium]
MTCAATPSELELRLGASHRTSDRVQLGFDARGRYNLSSDAKRAGTLTTDWELQALPTLSVALGAIFLALGGAAGAF